MSPTYRLGSVTEDAQGWTLQVKTVQMPAQPKPLIQNPIKRNKSLNCHEGSETWEDIFVLF